MRTFLLSEAQIIDMLNEALAGASVPQVCRRYGIGDVCHTVFPGDWRLPSVDPVTRNPKFFNSHLAYPQFRRYAEAQFEAGIRRQRFAEGWLHRTSPVGSPGSAACDNGPECENLKMYAWQSGLTGKLGPDAAPTRRSGRCVSDPLDWHAMFAAPVAARARQPRHYTDAFKARSVAVSKSIGRSAAARQLGIPVRTLDRWLRAARSAWSLGSWT